MGSRNGNAPRIALRCVDPTIVNRMMAQLPGETDEALMRDFGISYNTWRKVRTGNSIRRSVAERLERRLSLCNQETAK
jgi:hypothetical protein